MSPDPTVEDGARMSEKVIPSRLYGVRKPHVRLTVRKAKVLVKRN